MSDQDRAAYAQRLAEREAIEEALERMRQRAETAERKVADLENCHSDLPNPNCGCLACTAARSGQRNRRGVPGDLGRGRGMKTYLRDTDIFIKQEPVKMKLRVLACQFCGSATPPPTEDEQINIDPKSIDVFNRVRFVTPMEHYWPEGWRILADSADPRQNFDEFIETLVCPACASKISSVLGKKAE